MKNHYVRPDLANSALITIDTQCDTLDGQPLEVAGTSDALANMVELLKAFRQLGRPIVHIVRIYKCDGSNVDLCRRQAVENGAQIMLAGHDGCELAPDLLPDDSVRLNTELLLSGGVQSIGPMEVVIYKPRWGAFYNTPLEDHLSAHAVTSLVFAGCNYPNCPRASIYEASERDFKIALAEDALSGFYPRAKQELTNIGVWVTGTREIVNQMRS
jgi:nicotinamidase-related amidase